MFAGSAVQALRGVGGRSPSVFGGGSGGLSAVATTQDLLLGRESAPEDITPLQCLEAFFRDGVYRRQSQSTQQQPSQQHRRPHHTISAHTRLDWACAAAVILKPQVLLRRVQDAAAAAIAAAAASAGDGRRRSMPLASLQYRGGGGVANVSRRQSAQVQKRDSVAAKTRAAAARKGTNDGGDDGASSSSTSSVSDTESIPFASASTFDPAALSSMSMSVSRRGGAASSPYQSSTHQQFPSEPQFVVVVEDSDAVASAVAAPASSAVDADTADDESSYQQRPIGKGAGRPPYAPPIAAKPASAATVLSSAAATKELERQAELHGTRGVMIGFCRGSVEPLASSPLASILLPYAQASTAPSPGSFVVLRISSLLAAERRRTSSATTAATSDPRPDIAATDMGIFLVKAVHDAFRSAGPDHLMLVADVDVDDVAGDGVRPRGVDESQCGADDEGLRRHFGMRPLSRSRDFWIGVLGCARFCPAVMTRGGVVVANGAACDGELVFHMFGE